MKQGLGLFFLLLSSAVSSTVAHSHSLIDDGIQAKNNDFPSVIQIGSYQIGNGREVLIDICSGTIIASDLVLTASHCVNNNPQVIQRVSLAGDSTGTTDASVGGIKVVKGFTTQNSFKYTLECGMISKKVKSPEFEKMSDAEKTATRNKMTLLCGRMTGSDIAFLQLEKNQTFGIGGPSSLGCRSGLNVGAEVTIAGYGRKYTASQPGINLNNNRILFYGNNTVVSTSMDAYVYHFEPQANMQLPNRGDSGGPLFSKNDDSVVYGLTSGGNVDNYGRAIEADYVKLSSETARTVYSEISKSPDLPQSLKDALAKCLN